MLVTYTNSARKRRTSFLKIKLKFPSTLRSALAAVWFGLAVGSRTDMRSAWMTPQVKQIQ
jgi:hypothetical protein